MSLFFDRRFLFEAEDDGAAGADAGADTGATSVDVNATDNSGSSDNTEDTTNNDNNDNNNEEQPDDDINVDDTDDDFSIDSEPDAPDNNEDNNDNPPASSGPSDDKSSEPAVSADSLKAKDGDMFDSLEPAEQELKLKQLKTEYMNMYQVCDDIINRVNSLSLEFAEAEEELKRIVDSLFTTKKMISDYLLHIFDSKSYIENQIRYTEYLSIVNSIKNIMKDFEKGFNDTNSTS